MDVIVPGFTWLHHVRFTLMWNVFSRIVFRWFQCFWQWFFYMCCRLINRSLFLCYWYLCIQVSIICHVNSVCNERTDFLYRSFRHNILYHFLMVDLGITRCAKKYMSYIYCKALFSTLGQLVRDSNYCFTSAHT